MRHLNVITCYGWIDGPLGFILEYGERGELRQILDDREVGAALVGS